jgi:hypothetical protein
MELQGRSWPNLLGGVSGLGRPAHIGAVVADLDGLAGAGTRAAAVGLRGHFASLLHGHAVRCRHGWRAYLGRMIKDDSMGRFEVKLPLERRRQSARGSLPVCSPQASFGVARPSLWNV